MFSEKTFQAETPGCERRAALSVQLRGREQRSAGRPGGNPRTRRDGEERRSPRRGPAGTTPRPRPPARGPAPRRRSASRSPALPSGHASAQDAAAPGSSSRSRAASGLGRETRPGAAGSARAQGAGRLAASLPGDSRGPRPAARPRPARPPAGSHQAGARPRPRPPPDRGAGTRDSAPPGRLPPASARAAALGRPARTPAPAAPGPRARPPGRAPAASRPPGPATFAPAQDPAAQGLQQHVRGLLLRGRHARPDGPGALRSPRPCPAAPRLAGSRPAGQATAPRAAPAPRPPF